ncbi:hypothetical protein B0H11DRAFT_2323440 [Mycena galericulata]|nr:hypothetical protein B0H11DRAFT_2323440 [Mycena galericulata]
MSCAILRVVDGVYGLSIQKYWHLWESNQKVFNFNEEVNQRKADNHFTIKTFTNSLYIRPNPYTFPSKPHTSAANPEGGEVDAIPGAEVYYTENNPKNRSLRIPEILDQTTRESLHIIWKLWCERVIGRKGDPMSEQEIYNRWIHAINERIEIDRRLTDKLKFGKQYYICCTFPSPRDMEGSP